MCVNVPTIKRVLAAFLSTLTSARSLIFRVIVWTALTLRLASVYLTLSEIWAVAVTLSVELLLFSGSYFKH